MNNYQICTYCIMDNRTDATITFDEHGQCNYCKEALERKHTTYFPDEKGKQIIEEMMVRLKKQGKNKPYDCIMGLSGGLDSSYLAYLGAKKWGLRILGIHCDDGFDEPIGVKNVEKLVKAANIDLEIKKIDKEQFNDLTKAYMRAGVPNIAVPQDNIIFAYLYQYARKTKVNAFLSGVNFSLECVLQRGNTHTNRDTRNLKAIYSKYGRKSIDKLQILSPLERDITRFVLGIETYAPLNYIDYNRDRAIKELNDFCGFEYYGSKHLENKLTKFIQQYWLYNKFGVDKRTSHLSSMIVSEQLTREEALQVMQEPLYDEVKMEEDVREILQALDITRGEFEEIMKMKPRQHTEFAQSYYLKTRDGLATVIKRILGIN